MRTYSYNGIPVYPRNELVLDNGTRYPKNLWTKLSEEELTALGVTWVDVQPPEKFDSRYYWSHNNPKALEDKAEVDQAGEPVLDKRGAQLITLGLKSKAVNVVKQHANSLLSVSDWMVTRETTRNIAIPVEVRAYRDAVISCSEAAEASIQACETVEDLRVLTHDWPTASDDFSDWVPSTITKLQAIEHLDTIGKLDAFTLLVNSDAGMKLRFDAASVLDRNNPLLAAAAPVLDLDIDVFFREAVN